MFDLSISNLLCKQFAMKMFRQRDCDTSRTCVNAMKMLAGILK